MHNLVSFLLLWSVSFAYILTHIKIYVSCISPAFTSRLLPSSLLLCNVRFR
jgi:hypothetical protein